MENSFNTLNKVLIGGILLMTQSCYVYFEDDGLGCVRARGPLLTETRVVPEFNSVTNTIGADVNIR